MQHQRTQIPCDRSGSGNCATEVAFLLVALVAAYFLLKDHTVQVAGDLPTLLLATCPLVHLFGRRGRSHSHGGQRHATRRGQGGAAASREPNQ
jgi:Protein of unknown function (DUF2933)